MTIVEFKENVEKLKKVSKLLSGELQNVMNDDSISIDDRYEALIESGLGEQSWRTDFGLGDDEFLYEGPCYMSKHEKWEVDEILECLTEENFLTEEQIQTFKEYCVKNCYSSMKFDW